MNQNIGGIRSVINAVAIFLIFPALTAIVGVPIAKSLGADFEVREILLQTGLLLGSISALSYSVLYLRRMYFQGLRDRCLFIGIIVVFASIFLVMPMPGIHF